MKVHIENGKRNLRDRSGAEVTLQFASRGVAAVCRWFAAGFLFVPASRANEF